MPYSDFFDYPEYEDPSEAQRKYQEELLASVSPTYTDEMYSDPASLLAPPPPDEEDRTPPQSYGGGGGMASPEIMKQYSDWLGQMPARKQYEPSTGRKILAGLVGFLGGLQSPEAGARITEGILDKPYNEAVGDWQLRGKAIGNVGELGQRFAETGRKRASDIMKHTEAGDRIKTAREAIGQRMTAENLRHSDRLAAAKNDAERNAARKEHEQALIKLKQESNSIDRMEAETHKATQQSYSSRVTALNEKDKLGKGEKGVPYKTQQEAQMDSIIELLNEYPKMNKFFARDKDNPLNIYPKPGQDLSPEDMIDYRGFMNLVNKRVQQKLKNAPGLVTPYGMPDESEDLIPPMRPEIR